MTTYDAEWARAEETKRAWMAENGMFREEHEHSSCGVGLAVNIDGKASRDVVDAGISALKAIWHRGAVDADGKTLGRLASEIARRLRGKHKPTFTPHVDTGDYIVVVNAEKVAVTGNKLQDKMYHRHTGYVGNLKSISLEKQLQQAPERVLETAVKGMLPRNPLGRAMIKKLRIFAGPEHTHQAQQPKPLDI